MQRKRVVIGELFFAQTNEHLFNLNLLSQQILILKEKRKIFKAQRWQQDLSSLVQPAPGPGCVLLPINVTTKLLSDHGATSAPAEVTSRPKPCGHPSPPSGLATTSTGQRAGDLPRHGHCHYCPPQLGRRVTTQALAVAAGPTIRGQRELKFSLSSSRDSLIC